MPTIVGDGPRSRSPLMSLSFDMMCHSVGVAPRSLAMSTRSSVTTPAARE